MVLHGQRLKLGRPRELLVGRLLLKVCLQTHVRSCTHIANTHAVNKTKVLYGLPRDPELVAALVQLQEEEENENSIEDEKPKVSHHCYS